MKRTLLLVVLGFVAGCATEYDDRPRYRTEIRSAPSPIAPSYTTVPTIIEAGPPSVAATVGTSAGRASADARGELLMAVDRIMENWRPQPRELARTLIGKYGDPHEVTQNRMIWYNNGPWKRTVLLNSDVPHNFPVTHNDMLDQTIDYKVPADRIADVLAYNGSISIDRTRGEMSARCNSEEMNTMALNLAHSIITGERTAETARELHAETFTQHAGGVASPLTEKLQFVTAVGPTADPDQALRAQTERRELTPP